MQHAHSAVTARALSKHLNASQKACRAFLDGAELVAVGLRRAYLVDTVVVSREEATALRDTLRQHDSRYAGTFFLLEQCTGQAFLVNRRLLQDPAVLELAPLIDVESRKIASVSPETPPEITASIQQSLDQLICSLRDGEDETLTRGYVMVDLTLAPWCLSELNARRTMISLSGHLLEYSYIYCATPELAAEDSSRCLSNVPLTMLQLILEPPSGSAVTVLQFTVPLEHAQRSGDHVSRMEAKLETFKRRLVTSHSKHAAWTLKWITTSPVTLSSITL